MPDDKVRTVSIWNSEDRDCEIMGRSHLSPRWMFSFTYVYLTGEWSFACIYADDLKSAQEKFERIPSGLYFIKTIDRVDNVYQAGEKNFVPGTRIYDVREK